MAKPTKHQKGLDLKGGKGNDTLIGSNFGDKIHGKNGSDMIVGNGGNDKLTGGQGGDTFRYLLFSDSRASSGIDRINDFDGEAGDKVDLSALGTATLQSAYNAGFSGLQAVFTFDAATNTTSISYYQGSSASVFQISLTGHVEYSATAFIGIVNVTAAPSVMLENFQAAVGGTSVSFDIVADAAGVAAVQYRIVGTSEWATLPQQSVVDGATPFTVSGLSSETPYEFRVLVTDVGGNVSTPATGQITTSNAPDRFSWHWDTGDIVITDFDRDEGDQIVLASSRVERANLAIVGWVLVDDEFSHAARQGTDAGQIVQVDNGNGTFTLTLYLFQSDVPDSTITVNTKVIPSDFVGDGWVQYPSDPTEGDDNFMGFNGSSERISLLGGNDTYDGRGGSDQIDGGAGDDILRGGDPVAYSLLGSWISGGSGNDLLTAGYGNDTLDGGDGADALFGGDRGDTLSGGNDDDTLSGGSGGDELWGGVGADTFVYSHIGDSPEAASFEPAEFSNLFDSVHPDTIFDFNPGEGDIIDLRQLDANAVTPGVQTAAWTFMGNAYDLGFVGAQMTLRQEDIYTYEYDGAYDPRPGTILSLYLDDGDAIPDFQLQIAGMHTTINGILW